MNILYVFAHPNPHSFNAALKEVALGTLSEHNVTVSDLYQSGFKAVAGWDDFENGSATDETQYFFAQQAAYNEQTLAPDIKREIERLKAADHIIFHFPLWWFGAPAILKGWFDRVLVKGFAYDAGKVFENGLLKGKTASIITSTQSPLEAYQPNVVHGATIDSFLHPIHHTLRFVGIKPLTPFVAYAAFNLTDEQKSAYFEGVRKHLTR